MVRRLITSGVLVAAAAVGVPALYHYWTQPAEDQLTIVLRDFGFWKNHPPTDNMTVGSIYYVDPEVRFFSVICRADKNDLIGAMTEARSGNVTEDQLRKGRFASDIKVDLGALASGKLGHGYEQKVHYSLSDVFIEEIALGDNRLIFAKVMSKPECQAAVTDVILQGGYVCQGQKVLRATAEYKVDVDRNGGIGADVKINAAELKDAVKQAIETQSDQSVVERSGRLFSGRALKYGVAMNPTCVAPPHGRFARVLPRSKFARLKNFVLFSIVEPLLPAKGDEIETAELGS